MERENVSIRLSNHKREQIGSLVDQGYASNETDAHRKALNEGLRQYGVTVNGNGDTRLKWFAGELARLFAYVGVGWLVFFWAFPISFGMVGVVILFMALGLAGAYVALDAKEPAISQKLGIVEVEG